SEEVGPLLEKLLAGRAEVATEDRMRILRLIENLTLGRNAVGYLTESLHGAGSPQAQRIQIQRGMDVEAKKGYARALAGRGDGAAHGGTSGGGWRSGRPEPLRAPPVRCPTCGIEDDRVVDSRPADDGQAVRRRRECHACGARFT